MSIVNFANIQTFIPRTFNLDVVANLDTLFDVVYDSNIISKVTRMSIANENNVHLIANVIYFDYSRNDSINLLTAANLQPFSTRDIITKDYPLFLKPGDNFFAQARNPSYLNANAKISLSLERFSDVQNFANLNYPLYNLYVLGLQNNLNVRVSYLMVAGGGGGGGARGVPLPPPLPNPGRWTSPGGGGGAGGVIAGNIFMRAGDSFNVVVGGGASGGGTGNPTTIVGSLNLTAVGGGAGGKEGWGGFGGSGGGGGIYIAGVSPTVGGLGYPGGGSVSGVFPDYQVFGNPGGQAHIQGPFTPSTNNGHRAGGGGGGAISAGAYGNPIVPFGSPGGSGLLWINSVRYGGGGGGATNFGNETFAGGAGGGGAGGGPGAYGFGGGGGGTGSPGAAGGGAGGSGIAIFAFPGPFLPGSMFTNGNVAYNSFEGRTYITMNGSGTFQLSSSRKPFL